MPTPTISVVLITPDTFHRLLKTIRCLQRQTIRDRLEVVIVAPSVEAMGVDDRELAAFAASKLVAIGPISAVGPGKVAGTRAATADIVAFGEDHSFPEPGWAEALERAWQDGHGAVGAVLENANPSVLSWVDMLLNFGPHIALSEGGARPSLAWHNTSYRRADLLAFGDDLGRLMTVEALLQQALVAQGRTLHMEVRARTHHVNFSKLTSFLGGQFWGNRMYGDYRAIAETWSRPKRVVYAAALPLIALIRLRGALRELARVGPPWSTRLSLLPGLLFASGLAATGEAAGYLLGRGDGERFRARYELYRAQQVRPADRAVFEC